MEAVATGLIAVCMFAIVGFIVRGWRGSVPGGFDLRRAGVGRGVDGYLLVSVLALFGMVQSLLALIPNLGDTAPLWIVGAILVGALGLAVALRPVLAVLSLFSLFGVFASVSDSQGVGTAIAMLVLAAVAVWFFGLFRGFRRPKGSN